MKTMRTEKVNDTEFEDRTITKVRNVGDVDYEITTGNGWTLVATKPEGLPVPKVGDTVRYYGRGIGSVVRGLDVNGRKWYYRTETEEEQRMDDYFFPRTAKEALARWDNGDSIFTIELG